MDKFFESTTVLGLHYLHNRNSWHARILWTCVIVIGFAFAGFFIYESVLEWDSKQTITTLESIATPLYNNVPFPTVTVCPHEDSKPDNWAFVEKFYDLINSEKVRDDFVNDILKKLFKKLVSLYSNNTNSLKWEQNQGNLQYESHYKELSEFVCKKKISQDDLKIAVVHNFGRGKVETDAFYTLAKNIQKDDSPDLCTNECCQEWLHANDFNASINAGYFIFNFK